MSGKAGAPAGSRYEALDSLRGIAACGVALYHMHSTGILTELPIFRNGWLFVHFFFVLSGFVIAASYGEKLRSGFPLRAYLILRLGRIYPLHVFIILLLAAYDVGLILLDRTAIGGAAPFTGDRGLAHLLANLFLVQIFVPGGPLSWNAVSWSIAAEMWTYLLTALGLIWFRGRFRIVLCVIVLLAALVFAAGGQHPSSGPWSLLGCLFGFSIGMLAFELHGLLRVDLRRGAATLAEAAVLLAGAAAIWFAPPGPLFLACPFLFALAILVLAREQGALSDVLKLGPLRRLGLWSYSIYMVHLLVITLFLHALPVAGRWLGMELMTGGLWQGAPIRLIGGGGAVPDLLVLACLALVVATAFVTYRLIELPFRNASRRRAERIAGRRLAATEQVAPTI